MKLFNILFPVFLLSFVLSCSSTKETVKEQPVNTDISIPSFTSSSYLEVKIPEGWREISDNHNQLFDIWLVNDKNNAVISFIPIHINTDFNNNSSEEKLGIIQNIVLDKKGNDANNFEIEEEKKIAGNYEMKFLKLNLNDSAQGSILFGTGNNFYECLSYFNRGYESSLEELEALFLIQQQIVSTCKIK